MQNLEQQTLAGIALSNQAFIPVLEKYSLDFCCRGKKTLEIACTEKNLPIDTIVNELMDTVNTGKPLMPFTEMSIEQLITYIMIHHHFYVKNSIGTILSHISKVEAKHGVRYPHMEKILALFTAVADELIPHMEKEEKILFPRIKEISEMCSHDKFVNIAPGFLTSPIRMMEIEHDNAGQLLFEIRELTNDYTAPEDACTTHRVCLQELKAFEEDLHQHVHLENNILFPLAINLVASMNN